jgi:hypothetical protein
MLLNLNSFGPLAWRRIFQMRHPLNLFAAALLGFAALSTSAKAEMVIDVTQQGSNVVITGLGTLDLTDLTAFTAGTVNAEVSGATGTIVVGSGFLNFYHPVSGPSSIGSGGVIAASSSSGGAFGIDLNDSILVSSSYISGSFISGSDQFDNTTIAALGLTPGNYAYTWGSGPDADSLTLNIGSVSPVPEASTWAMIVLGFAGVGMAYRRKSKRQTLMAA